MVGASLVMVYQYCLEQLVLNYESIVVDRKCSPAICSYSLAIMSNKIFAVVCSFQVIDGIFKYCSHDLSRIQKVRRVVIASNAIQMGHL